MTTRINEGFRMWNLARAIARGIVRPVMVWALVLAGAATAGAQQTSRPATTRSLNSVTRFLNMAGDVPWLRAHGITATDASTLVPLDAATSPSLCARLDSAFYIGPITAFRAGAYIIATNWPIALDPVTGKKRSTEMSPVRVFDSVGVYVYLPGTGLGPNGGYALLGYGTFTSTANANHRINYSVFASDHRLWADGILQVSAIDATPANDIAGNLSLNVYGSGGVGTVRYDDLIVTASRAVTMAGLPDGHRIRINGLLSHRATGGASVTVDLLGTKLPASRVEILNANDVIVKAFGPSDGVWGGDRYSLNGAP
ncbi:MAG: hypothetical protein LH467_11980 [Gemmatimonadaceae bacterium]|nr:hypothetical protein [Gemmatimonadaceae bacterium]